MKGNQTKYTPDKVSVKDYIRIFKGVRLPWLFFILIFVSAIASAVSSLFVTYFTGDMVDAQGNIPTVQLLTFVAGYIGIGLCSAGSTIFQGVASERINLGLRQKLWRKIIYTKQSCYDKDSGETLVSRVTADCDYASKLFTTIISFISLLVSLGMFLVQMYTLNVRMSNYMMFLIPVSVLIGWGYSKLMYLIAQKKQAMLANATTYLIERTKELTLVKTSNSQDKETVRGTEMFEEQYKAEIQTGLMNALYVSMQTLYSILGILIPFAVGAGLVSQGLITSGQVIIFYGISTNVGLNFTNIVQYVGEIKQANGALARVIKTMELPEELLDQGMELDIPDADITFENVSFGYGKELVLKELSCQIPKHKVTAVIGVNGSGKSTMFKLLDRLYEPEKGKLLFGDTQAEAYNLHSWRKAFGIVAQGSPLMEGTIRENICYGCEREVSDEELTAVAKASHIYDFVHKLPEGFQTMITAGGQNLSGGQKQCIAIARAMMSSPDYLLLDEATCSLDVKSESAVMDALSQLMKDRTTVIIAHSLATIKNADHVIILRDGRVEGSGGPKEILRSSNNYLEKIMNRRRATPA